VSCVCVGASDVSCIVLTQERGRAPKVHLNETVIALHKYNRKHQLKVF